MARWYSRVEQKKYREERRAKAQLVADRLTGRLKPFPFFSGTEMQSPIQYGDRAATGVSRMNAMAINKMMGPV